MVNKKRLLLISIIIALVSLLFLTIDNPALIDFQVYYTSEKAFSNGRTDFYSPEFALGELLDYRYPPIFLFLFFPLWSFPYLIAVYIWGLLNVTSLYLLFTSLRRYLETILANLPHIGLFLVIAFLITTKYLIPTLKQGNIHLIILCLTFGAFLLLAKRKDLTAACFMALAISIKVYPLISLPYFAIKKKWRFLILTGAFVVFFNLIPAFYFGFNENFVLLDEWYDHVVLHDEFHRDQGPLDLSLRGQLERFLVDIDYTKRIYDQPYQKLNILSISRQQANRIWMVSAVAIYLSTLSLIWYLNRLRIKKILQNSIRDDLDFFAFIEFSLMICLMIIIPPSITKLYFLHYFFR